MTSVAAAVPVLLVLLTWLSFRAIDADAEHYDRTLKALDRFAVVETALHRDVLSARTGMLRNYDPLVWEVNALREALDRLRNNASRDAEERAVIARFSEAAARQEELTEQFKSDNALLQNSLAHFRLFSARLSGADAGDGLARAVSVLAAAMLQLTLDTSPAAAREVMDQLNRLAAQPITPRAGTSVDALLAHARLLHDLLPKIDGILRALLAAPSKQELKALRTMVLSRQAASRATAREFRLLLYAASLLLLGLLVYLGLQLRARALMLHRRAAFEHMMVGMSTRLIDAQPHEIDAHIDRALAELGEHVCADRAYVVTTGGPTRKYSWCREGTTFPPEWPDRVPTLMACFPAIVDGIIQIQSVNHLPPSTDKDVLAAAGLRGWICASKSVKSGRTIVLGFDALRAGTALQCAEVGLLRMALDAIANVLVREHLLYERARLETNLQQARRMETVGALASGIAHNFNNIVGAILGYAEMAEAQHAFDPGSAYNLKEIRRAGERARDLVDQILAFGRRREVGRKPVALGELIGETKSLLVAALPTQIKLVIGEVPQTAVVSGHPGQVQQIIVNLCNNAAQAMNQIGRIDITTEVLEIKAPRSLTHGMLRSGRYVCIAVSDRGRGMDEATLARIFEPFFTTRLTGRGLGLATVREIVQEHVGAINVWTMSGVGSRFEVWLPCIAAATVATPDNLPGLALGHGETVLLIDDASGRLLAEEEVLAALGYEPVGFARVSDALAACRTTPKRFDLSVVGHLAGAASTIDLVPTLREIVPGLPILLATASTDEIDADRLVAADISEVVHLPLVPAEIASALARCLTASKISARALHS